MGKILDAVREKNGGNLSPEQEKFVAGIEKAISEELTDMLKVSEERYSKAMEQVLDTIGTLPVGDDGKSTKIVDQLRAMAEKMDKIESASQRKLNSMEKFQLRKALDANRDAIIKAVNSGSPNEVEIKFNATRAPQMMTTQNVFTGDMNIPFGAVVDNDVAYLRYPENFVLDIINSRQVTKVPPQRVKLEQDAREGQAVVVPEGGLKPLVSYTFKKEMFDRIKVAAHMEWTEELEMDFEELFNSILDLFERDILRDWHNIVLQQIITSASSYVSTSLDGTIPFPNIYTAIGAGILSVQNMRFRPDVIWMNQADVWAMNLSQDSTGQVIVPPIMVGNNQIAGLRLYVSDAIEQGHVLIGESGTWREEHTGFISRIGLINDQLIHNEKTIVGEVYSLMYQRTSEQGSWIYLDLAAVMEALQRPAA